MSQWFLFFSNIHLFRFIYKFAKKLKQMDLKDLLWIPGKPGLYRIVSQVKSATIVESLKEKTKFPIYMSDRGTKLDELGMFTTGEEIPVKDVMDMIYDKESGGPCIDSKSEDIMLKKYFEEVLPTYDKERIHVSDMRKLFMWYNTLHSLGLLKKEAKVEKPVDETSVEPATDEKTDKEEKSE
jgi:hypothetical protein